MPAAVPGICASRWTLLDVASGGGSGGSSPEAGAANATTNSAASHLVALPPTESPIPTCCRFHGSPSAEYARHTMASAPEQPDWRLHGVRVVHAGELDVNTPQTPGMNRAAAIDTARAGAEKLWAG